MSRGDRKPYEPDRSKPEIKERMLQKYKRARAQLQDLENMAENGTIGDGGPHKARRRRRQLLHLKKQIVPKRERQLGITAK